MNTKKNSATLICLLLMAILSTPLTGCGSKTNTPHPKPVLAGVPIDPSGNWKLAFTDANSNTFILSALFSQVGADVTGISFSEVGNTATFQCSAQTNVTMANGTVLNVSTFSGDISGNFGAIHFTSTLNPQGSHADGTYTLTPGPAGNCLGVALTGTFTADEVPSMSGNWTGTVSCRSNCPLATPVGTAGSMTATLAQNDATGAVTGSYVINGLLPLLSAGTISTTSADLLSGASWQDTVSDNTGSSFFIAGGPLSSNGTTGVGQDRSFNGILIMRSCCSDTTYLVNMSH